MTTKLRDALIAYVESSSNPQEVVLTVEELTLLEALRFEPVDDSKPCSKCGKPTTLTDGVCAVCVESALPPAASPKGRWITEETK